MKKVAVHGTPITPRHLLGELAGKSFCVSYADPRDADRCAELVDRKGILFLDNGAFSCWTRGITVDWADYYKWAARLITEIPCARAVCPDVIGGSVEQNLKLIDACPLPFDRTYVVWHLNEPLDLLANYARRFPLVAFGSAGEFAVVGTKAWDARIRAAFAVIDDVEAVLGRRPSVHQLRGLAQLARFPFDSADSTNVARNHCRYKHTGPGYVRRFADRIEAAIAA